MAQFTFHYTAEVCSSLKFILDLDAETYFCTEYFNGDMVDKYPHRIEIHNIKVLEVELDGWVLAEDSHTAFEEFLTHPDQELSIVRALEAWDDLVPTVEPY